MYDCSMQSLCWQGTSGPNFELLRVCHGGCSSLYQGVNEAGSFTGLSTSSSHANWQVLVVTSKGISHWVWSTNYGGGLHNKRIAQPESECHQLWHLWQCCIIVKPDLFPHTPVKVLRLDSLIAWTRILELQFQLFKFVWLFSIADQYQGCVAVVTAGSFPGERDLAKISCCF